MLTIDPRKLDLQPGMLCLDLGCGLGRHSYEVMRHGGRVVPFDLDDGVVKDTAAMCTALMEEGAVPPSAGASPVVGTALQLPFRDAVFDRIIASEVLEHIERDDEALSEIARVLKPHGRLAVTVPRYWPERVCWFLSAEYHASPGGHVRIYTRRGLAGRIRSAGLSVDARGHHAHALHSPYWWLRCVGDPDDTSRRAVAAYKRLLERQILRPSRTMTLLERGLDPVLGKSLVLYATKPAEDR